MKKMLITLLALALGSVASAATLKIATVTPEGSQWMKDMRESAKEIKERTDGRVQIKYYGGGVMGNDQKVLSRIRLRSLQGGAFTPAALSDIYPDLNIYGMPLVFDSEEEAAYVRKRLDSKLQQGLETAGFVNFGFAAGGFAMVMSNTPVRSLDDLKGKRVWVPEGDSISYSSMEALSLAPVTVVQPIQRTALLFRVGFSWMINREHEIIGLSVLIAVGLSMIGVLAVTIDSETLVALVPMPTGLAEVLQWRWPAGREAPL
jgi:TRAP-type C4-dicarboxylate transport system substrate-binding protein